MSVYIAYQCDGCKETSAQRLYSILPPQFELPGAWNIDQQGSVRCGLCGPVAVALVRRPYPCRGCGEAFVPTRAPREGENSWCDKPECKTEARRVASRRHYAARIKSRADEPSPGVMYRGPA